MAAPMLRPAAPAGCARCPPFAATAGSVVPRDTTRVAVEACRHDPHRHDDEADQELMERDKAEVGGVALSLLALALLIVLDLSIPPDYAVLTGLFGLVPLIACAFVSAWGTAAIAGLAIGTAVGSGVWNDTWGTPQQSVRLLNVV